MKIGDVTLSSNLLLAPIAGYCDLAFRLVARGIRCPIPGTPGTAGTAAVGLACTDLLCPQAVLNENPKSLWLAATCPEDQPLCMQLYGVDPDIMAQAALWAQDHGATIIDINMGCPVDKVTKKNGGSMLLCDPTSTVRLAKRIVNSVRIPVTAKIRLGWDDRSIVGPTLAPALADVGITAITVHGRTTAQKFRDHCRLNGIASVVQAMKHHPRVPVIGNGDVKSPQDAKRMLETTGCTGVMIGRGALGQPWIFRDTAYYLATGELPPPMTHRQKAAVVVDHFKTLCRLRDTRIALNMIRQRMSWYSAYLQPWPGLRRDIRMIESADEFFEFMARGVDRIEAGATEHAATMTAVSRP